MNTAEKNIMSPEYRRCYACLNRYKDGLVPLDTEDRDKITYLEKLRTLIGQDLIERNRMEICPQCKIKLRIGYQFKVSVLSCQVVLKLQKKRGLNIRLPQRVKTKLRIVKKGSGEVKRHKGIASPQSSMDLASDLNQPSESAPQQDDNDVSADLSADEGDSSFNLEDYLVVKDKDRAKSEQNKHEVGKNERLYCNICCKKFDNSLELEKHKTSEHKVWVHVCPHCPQRYGHFFELKAHLTLRHRDGKSYTCDLCGRKNSALSDHLRHMRSHQMPSGQKRPRNPFLCTVCGKTFADTNGRARHMKVHAGLKPFECAVCHKKFGQKQHLVIHLRSHTGEKSYICEVCGEAFSIRSTLKSHISRKHGKSKESESVVQSNEPESSKTPPAPMFYSREFEELHQRMLT